MAQESEQSAQGGVESQLARHGKVSYMQIPSPGPQATADFYAKVFGWQVGGRPEHVSFSDASGELAGAFVPNRTPSAPESGVLPFIYVTGIEAVVAKIQANGGEIVLPVYREGGGLLVATFRDPAGNVLGVWEEAPAS